MGPASRAYPVGTTPGLGASGACRLHVQRPCLVLLRSRPADVQGCRHWGFEHSNPGYPSKTYGRRWLLASSTSQPAKTTTSGNVDQSSEGLQSSSTSTSTTVLPVPDLNFEEAERALKAMKPTSILKMEGATGAAEFAQPAGSAQANTPSTQAAKPLPPVGPKAVKAPPPAKAPVKPAFKIVNALICVGLGLAVRFLVPIPSGIEHKSWTLLSVFICTVAGLVLEPLPVSAWSMCCLTGLLSTKAVTFQQALSGLTNEAIWLIVFAFFFARAFEKTGLGERLANMFVAAVGHSTLGLSYALAAAELLMAPAMPSCTARAGGIFMPVIKFLAKGVDSEPHKHRKRLGAFLVHSQMQVSPNVAAIFLTAAAQNLLAINIARNMGVVIPDVWMTWFVGAIVPGLISVAMIPAICYFLVPPEVRSTPEAPAAARKRLAQMGPLTRGEGVTLACLGMAVVMWMGGEALDIPAVLAAMIALSGMLLSGVLSWRDCLNYTPAWDTLVWFSVLVSMCSGLSSSGLVGRMADMVAGAMAGANMHWLAAFGVLHAIFFWGHYVFASQVGHVGALYGAFLAMMISAGAPVQLSAITLGYSANLFGSLTHYASGPAAVFHGSGYTSMTEVLGTGALMALRSWLVWGVFGMAWWKYLGWW